MDKWSGKRTFLVVRWFEIYLLKYDYCFQLQQKAGQPALLTPTLEPKGNTKGGGAVLTVPYLRRPGSVLRRHTLLIRHGKTGGNISGNLFIGLKAPAFYDANLLALNHKVNMGAQNGLVANPTPPQNRAMCLIFSPGCPFPPSRTRQRAAAAGARVGASGGGGGKPQATCGRLCVFWGSWYPFQDGFKGNKLQDHPRSSFECVCFCELVRFAAWWKGKPQEQ